MSSAKDLLKDPTKTAFTLLEEFKNFALKGNVVDLAVGVIIGGAFGKIVDSLVNHIIMPTIGLLMPGEQGYEAWKPFGIEVGSFLSTIVNFLIVAGALWLFIVKFLGFLMKTKSAATPAAPPEPTKEEVLLTEIRDLLKNRAA